MFSQRWTKYVVFWGTTSCTLVDRYYQSRLHRTPEQCNLTKILQYGIYLSCTWKLIVQWSKNLCKPSPRLTIQQMEDNEGKNHYDVHRTQLALRNISHCSCLTYEETNTLPFCTLCRTSSLIYWIIQFKKWESYTFLYLLHCGIGILVCIRFFIQ